MVVDTIHLKAGRERSVLRRHPWLLSGSVDRVEGDPLPGAWVALRSSKGDLLGHGHWSPTSQIRVRILSFGDAAVDDTLIEARIASALARRDKDPALRGTNALRLINAEGDALPGLIVDRYADALVLRPGSAGMFSRQTLIGETLRRLTGASVALARPDPRSARREGIESQPSVLWGEVPKEPVAIEEGARRYLVDLQGGQKTGFYLDQRLSRGRVESVAQGARMLDLFAYTGGFSLAAAHGGAGEITAVDSSAPALALAEEHLHGALCTTRVVQADAFQFVRDDAASYDLIVVDPPPLARRSGDTNRALRAYKDVILHALYRAAPDANVFVFCCSHHVAPELFRKVVFGASIDAKKSLQVIEELSSPSDHPVALDHPQGRYLSGLWLRV